MWSWWLLLKRATKANDRTVKQPSILILTSYMMLRGQVTECVSQQRLIHIWWSRFLQKCATRENDENSSAVFLLHIWCQEVRVQSVWWCPRRVDTCFMELLPESFRNVPPEKTIKTLVPYFCIISDAKRSGYRVWDDAPRLYETYLMELVTSEMCHESNARKRSKL